MMMYSYMEMQVKNLETGKNKKELQLTGVLQKWGKIADLNIWNSIELLY